MKNLGNLQEAIHCFDEAILINKKNVNAWKNKGKFFFSMKKIL